MSIVMKKVIVYSNLPSGGASMMEKILTKEIKKVTEVRTIDDRVIRPKSFINYLIACLVFLPILHKRLARYINKEFDVLVAHHSWMTKSPHILRYFRGAKIYICQELLREYYDVEHIKAQSLKERLINTIRLPIKYLDKTNLKSKKLIVITNSKFSKKLVDKYYDVKSTVIYPGIETARYYLKNPPTKVNQVISVGAINKLKRYEYFIDVLSMMEKSCRPKLVIVGNGGNEEYQNFLTEISEKKGVQLEIILNASHNMLLRQYYRSQAFIYAPISEPFGVVVEEAMACGLPLFVYRHGGGYNEIISARNGAMLDNLNSETWSRALDKFLSDKKSLSMYGNYNKKYVEKYNSKFMTESLINIIKNL